MDKSILIISFFCVSSQSYAMSDAERAVIFAANAASGGTYLADLESEKAQIRMEHERITAQSKLKMDLDQQERIRKALNQDLTQLQSTQEKADKDLVALKEEQQSFLAVLDLLEKTYQSQLTLDELKIQLQQRAETMKYIDQTWKNLAADKMLAVEAPTTKEKLEPLLKEALQTQYDFDVLIHQTEEFLADLSMDIETLQTRLEGLKK